MEIGLLTVPLPEDPSIMRHYKRERSRLGRPEIDVQGFLDHGHIDPGRERVV